jgi:high-affinity Fe2+/Pb2+ permease
MATLRQSVRTWGDRKRREGIKPVLVGTVLGLTLATVVGMLVYVVF